MRQTYTAADAIDDIRNNEPFKSMIVRDSPGKFVVLRRHEQAEGGGFNERLASSWSWQCGQTHNRVSVTLQPVHLEDGIGYAATPADHMEMTSGAGRLVVV